MFNPHTYISLHLLMQVLPIHMVSHITVFKIERVHSILSKVCLYPFLHSVIGPEFFQLGVRKIARQTLQLLLARRFSAVGVGLLGDEVVALSCGENLNIANKVAHFLLILSLRIILINY